MARCLPSSAGGGRCPVVGRVAGCAPAERDDLIAMLAPTNVCAAADRVDPWLAGAEINRDRNLRLQYLAGMGKHVNEMEDHFE